MRKFVVLTAAVAMLFASQAGAALVGHWTFDDGAGETAADSVNGNDATWMGGSGNNTWVSGLIGGATLHNDEDGGNGEEHFATGAIAQLAGANKLTLTIWFNQDSDENNNSTYNGLFISRDNDPGSSWGIALEDNGAPRHLDGRINGQAVDSADIISGDSGWHHAAITWDGTTGTTKVYLDGDVDITTGSTLVGALVTSSGWRFGDDSCCGSREFTGTLDDAGMWDEVLSDGQIKTIYDNGLKGIAIPEPGTLALIGLGGLAMALRRRR